MPEISDKQALQYWNEYAENLRKQTALLTGENEEQQRRRIAILEADPELWFKYYFPQYAYAEPAPFHKAATKRVLNNLEWYEVRMWSRELAKSTRTMMEVFYLTLTGKKRYVLMISNSFDNAERLLMPYKINLQQNQRIIHDYGAQELPGKWEASEFTTRKGVAYRALGAGQSPRGTRNEEVRPDVLLFDDIDTDEECRNEDIINKKWNWIEEAAIGTRSISKHTTIIFCGNRIAEDCCVQRASEYADHASIINIRDANGQSTWPTKNTEEFIDRVLSQKSYEAQQKEYFNNPMGQGRTFKEITWGKCPPLKRLKFVVIYADPSTSNKDKPSLKAKAQNSCKAVFIVGYLDGKYYVYTGWLDVTTNAIFVDWLYAAEEYVGIQTMPYIYIENNTLQDPFFEQVLMPLIWQKGKQRGKPISVMPDTRKKPEKWFRIEGTLEPINRVGNLIFNIQEKDNPHMKRLEAQFKAAGPNSKVMDGPDDIEGAVFITQQKITVYSSGSLDIIDNPVNSKRF